MSNKLPAVGSVRMIKRGPEWTSVEVIAHYADQAVIAWTEEGIEHVELRCASDLRRELTPQQIAEKKRSREAGVMFAIFCEETGEHRQNMEGFYALYDAGFRHSPLTPDEKIAPISGGSLNTATPGDEQ